MDSLLKQEASAMADEASPVLEVSGSPANRQEALLFLKKGLFFTLGAAILFLLLNHAVEARVDEATKLQFQELLHPTGTRQAVIFGDSHSINGINPKYLEREGVSVYNFSFPGADSIYYQDWYPLFKRYYPKPQIALVQLDWFSFLDAPYLYRTIEVDAEYLPWRMMWDLTASKSIDDRKLWTSRFPLFQHRQKVDRLLVPGDEFADAYIQDYYHGFIPVSKNYTPGGVLRFAAKSERREAMRLWVKRLQADGVKVVFVQTPEFLQARDIDPEYEEQATEFAREVGAPFLNFNTDLVSEINSDPSNYADWGHMNARGARLFSERLNLELGKLQAWKDL